MMMTWVSICEILCCSFSHCCHLPSNDNHFHFFCYIDGHGELWLTLSWWYFTLLEPSLFKSSPNIESSHTHSLIHCSGLGFSFWNITSTTNIIIMYNYHHHHHHQLLLPSSAFLFPFFGPPSAPFATNEEKTALFIVTSISYKDSNVLRMTSCYNKVQKNALINTNCNKIPSV